jgi:energy-coupling factor transporter ATP-binding protein EcfA2
MINTKNVKVVYPELTIKFDDVTIKENLITFIKGPNGSGKTTLLKSLSNLLEYEGEIVGNNDITYNSPKPVLFNMTVLENITYPLRIRKLNIESYMPRINNYVEKLNLTPLLQKNAHKLSDGEQKKTSILRSIIFGPKILLLDEPTTSLDVESIEELTILLKELREEMTIIIVSHDRSFIEELHDDVVELGGNYV